MRLTQLEDRLFNDCTGEYYSELMHQIDTAKENRELLSVLETTRDIITLIWQRYHLPPNVQWKD